MRDHEKNGLSTAFFFLLGVLLSITLYSRTISDLLILFVSFGDPMASVVGITIRSPKIIGNKSLAGISGCIATCFLVSLIYFQGANILVCLMCGVIAAVA